MHKKPLFLLLIVFLPLLVFGQEKKAAASRSMGREQSSVSSLLENAERISDRDPKKALDYLEEALSISLKQGDKLGEANTYVTLGKLNAQQGLVVQAINFYNKAISIFQKEKEDHRLMNTRKLLGQTYENNKNYDEALEQYQKALKQAEATKNENEILALKNSIANIYKLQGKNEDALLLYKEVLKKEQKQKNKAGEIDANNNIGDVYLQQRKTTEAKDFYESSQEIALEDQDAEKLNTSYGNIINTYKLEGKHVDEMELRKEKAEVNKKRNDQEALSEDYLEIGKLFLQQKKLDQALSYLEKSARISRSQGLLEKEALSEQAISSVYKQQKNFPKALDHYERYISLKDSLLKSKEELINTKLSINETLTLKQKQIDLLEKDMHLNEATILLLREEKKFSKLVIYALSLGILLVLFSSWMVYTNAKKRRMANQALILRSLRSQMNPHFIFNALNSVNNFISKNDERSANKYLSDFSKLMRTVMENSRHEFISLSTELNILELYLSLEHARFKEKFDYELTVSDVISADQMQIPPMLVQPYIENAIWHGLRYKEQKGMLRVNFIQKTNEIQVSIEDDGIGRKKSLDIKTHNQKDKDSIGLKNTEARINIINELYKTNMRVSVEDLYPNKEECGTRVILYITQTNITEHEA